MPKKICEQCYISAIEYMKSSGKFVPYKSIFPGNFTLNTPECEVHGMKNADILMEIENWCKPIYSNSVMSRCRQRLDLEPDDISRDNDIMVMSKRDILDECLQWEGIIGYRDLILTWVNDIYGIDFERS